MSLSARVKNMKFMRMADEKGPVDEEAVGREKLVDLSEWKSPMADLVRERAKARRARIKTVGYTQIYQMIEPKQITRLRAPPKEEPKPEETETPATGIAALRAGSRFAKRKDDDDIELPVKKRKT
ncbi:hypothetical protein OGAPHI_003646 [Ogataea philodendri]|uniref:Uncharacterized protein n=1 Tax=Ogataea philodendri TaxID=1378263 RepID=A0A9P8P5A7_9ASCO|nr:uncharacterized protein OGAPHI_003646 [Ogataea philodendri]KAH3665462.1 hypothetical protein OGAPHI_003646 [Ogataea philodendri]